MIVMQCGAHLPQLGIASGFRVALPDSACTGTQHLPVVVCLHDYAQNSECMLHTLGFATLVDTYHVALLLPDGQNSCFVDMAQGPNWQTYLLEGLIPFAQRTFPLGDRVCLLGVGTGGWAAARMAAQYGDRFCGCVALNATVDLPHLYAKGQLSAMPDLEAVFGEPDRMPAFPLSPTTRYCKEMDQAIEALQALLGSDGTTTL